MSLIVLFTKVSIGEYAITVLSCVATSACIAMYVLPGAYFDPAGGFVSYRRVTVSHLDFSVSQLRVTVFGLGVGGFHYSNRISLPIGTGVAPGTGRPGRRD